MADKHIQACLSDKYTEKKWPNREECFQIFRSAASFYSLFIIVFSVFFTSFLSFPSSA